MLWCYDCDFAESVKDEGIERNIVLSLLVISRVTFFNPLVMSPPLFKAANNGFPPPPPPEDSGCFCSAPPDAAPLPLFDL